MPLNCTFVYRLQVDRRIDGLIEHSAHRKTSQLRAAKLNYFSLYRTRRHDSVYICLRLTKRTTFYMYAEMKYINSKFPTAHVP